MTVGIIGLGLIGGSFAKAAAAKGHEILVWNRTGKTALASAEALEKQYGVSSGVITGPGDIARCRVVIVCLPPGLCAKWVAENETSFSQGAIVCDAAGVKGAVMEELRRFALNNRWTFIGAHPMAGKEHGGWENSSEKLFNGASIIFTPWPSSGRGPLDELEAFMKSIGFGRIVYTDPARHDEMIAYTSQLPHAISYSYAANPLAAHAEGFTGGSFQDMTRISASDAHMWAQLFAANREHFLAAAKFFQARFTKLVAAVENGDEPEILQALLSPKPPSSEPK